jgi:hypothetical protein
VQGVPWQSLFQVLTPEVIPSRKYHMNKGPILNGYTADVSNSLWSEHSVEQVIHAPCSIKIPLWSSTLLFYFAFVRHVVHVTGGVRSGDRSGHGSIRTMLMSGNSLFMFSFTFWLKCGVSALSRWKQAYICNDLLYHLSYLLFLQVSVTT